VAGDWLTSVSVALVDLRRLQAQAAFFSAGEDQVSILQIEFSRAIKLQFGLRGIGARSDLEVVFQLALLAVEN